MTSRFVLEIAGEREEYPRWDALLDRLEAVLLRVTPESVDVVELAKHRTTGAEIEVARWTLAKAAH